MKYIFTIALSFLFGMTTTFAQNDSIPVNLTEEVADTDTLPGIPFVSYWELGDSYDFKITKVKKRFKDGVITKNDSSSYIANFTILDSTETNYRIKWTYQNNLTAYKIPDSLLTKLAEHNLTEVIYQTSEVGEFITIENWEEISKVMKSIFATVIDGIVAEGKASRAYIEKSMKPMMMAYESKQGIESVILKELQYFHFPFGVEFSPIDTIFYEEDLPNMFGGDPIRSDVVFYVDSVDYENAFCILEQRRTLNPADTKKLLSSFFENLAKDDKQSKEMQEALKQAKFDIQDTNSYQYYYYPGIPFKVSCLRKTIMNFSGEDQIATELTTIELQN